MTDLSQFKTKAELFAFLKENKDMLVSEKKQSIKHTDAVSYMHEAKNKNGDTIKTDSEDFSNVSTINAKLVLNTTNVMDSHSDVHIKGIWNKTLSEIKRLPLLQEHVMKFENVITEKVSPSTKTMQWSKLGADYQGSTQALIFDVEIDKDRNPYMFEQYIKGYVKNHSVGMRYVKIFMCVNSEERYWSEEKEMWDEYINEVANKEEAEAQGCFWIVKEAKLIEGSAVVLGSNRITPTLNVESKNEPSKGTQKEQPLKNTVTIEEFKQELNKQLKN